MALDYVKISFKKVSVNEIVMFPLGTANGVEVVRIAVYG
jgi:hypothetical protein